MLLHHCCHRRTSHSISVNNDLFRQTLSFSLVITHSISDKIFEDTCSILSCKIILNFSAFFARVLCKILFGNFISFLGIQSCIALSESLWWSCAAPYNFIAFIVDNVYTNHHRILQVWQVHSVEILLHLSIHLFKQIREHTQRQIARKFSSSNKLRYHTTLVKEFFDFRLKFWLKKYHTDN